MGFINRQTPLVPTVHSKSTGIGRLDSVPFGTQQQSTQQQSTRQRANPPISKTDQPPPGKTRSAQGRGTGKKKAPGWFTSAPQSILLSEAEKLRDERDWRTARRVLDAANATAIDKNDRRRVLELTATTAAEASKHRISSNAVYELSQIEPRSASTWVVIGDVALARGNYQHADTAAREALKLDPASSDAHLLLSASFAGLGWFNDASSCLDSVDRTAITARHRHQLGQAVNRWATTKTMAFPLAVLAALATGVLAISVGLGVPIITRHLRLRQLSKTDTTDNIFVETARSSWAEKKVEKAFTGVAMILPVLFYLGLLLTAG